MAEEPSEPEETMLWFGRSPDESGAAEMEVVTSAARPAEASIELPGGDELDEALAEMAPIAIEAPETAPPPSSRSPATSISSPAAAIARTTAPPRVRHDADASRRDAHRHDDRSGFPGLSAAAPHLPRLSRSGDARAGSGYHRPRCLPFDAQTALVVVDLQNDFADPAGSLAVAGGAGVIPVVNGAMEAAASAGAMVVATQDWHPESTPHFAKDGGIWPVHCVGGTWGAELHPAFELPADAPRIRKGTNGEDGYCGFIVRDPVTGEEMPTELEGLLRDRGIERLVVAGLATDYCVKATAIDAVRLGFGVSLLADGVAAVNLEPGDGERAIQEMAAAGVEIG